MRAHTHKHTLKVRCKTNWTTQDPCLNRVTSWKVYGSTQWITRAVFRVGAGLWCQFWCQFRDKDRVTTLWVYPANPLGWDLEWQRCRHGGWLCNHFQLRPEKHDNIYRNSHLFLMHFIRCVCCSIHCHTKAKLPSTFDFFPLLHFVS